LFPGRALLGQQVALLLARFDKARTGPVENEGVGRELRLGVAARAHVVLYARRWRAAVWPWLRRRGSVATTSPTAAIVAAHVQSLWRMESAGAWTSGAPGMRGVPASERPSSTGKTSSTGAGAGAMLGSRRQKSPKSTSSACSTGRTRL